MERPLDSLVVVELRRSNNTCSTSFKCDPIRGDMHDVPVLVVWHVPDELKHIHRIAHIQAA
jgi:hypothetical protein